MVDKMEAGQTLTSFFRKHTSQQSEWAGNWYDTASYRGMPLPLIYYGTDLEATLLNYRSVGGLYHGENVAPATKHIYKVSAFSSTSNANPCHLILCDYLMFYPEIETNSIAVQNFTNPVTIPRYTTGEGVKAFLVYTSEAGILPQKVRVTYTNSQGVTGRCLGRMPAITMAGSPLVPGIPGLIMTGGAWSGTLQAPHNHGVFLPLAEGDTGIQSVQNIQFNTPSGISSQAALVLCKPLCSVAFNNAFAMSERNYWMHLPSLPRVMDGAYLAFLRYGGSASVGSLIWGQLDVVWG